jgi:hypothetical protein
MLTSKKNTQHSEFCRPFQNMFDVVDILKDFFMPSMEPGLMFL